MGRKATKITFIILGIAVIATIIIYTALPTMGKVVGLAGIQVEDISYIKFVVPRESQEAWDLDDTMVIAEIISYFNGLKAIPSPRTGGGALAYLHVHLLEANGSDDNIIKITISNERRYSGKNDQTYYALGKVKSSEQWEEILAMCSKSEESK